MTLVVDQLGHRYGALKSLREVSVEARRGAITTLIGPNAAGKSTLLRCIIGALRPSAGAVLLDDKPAHRMSPYHLARRVSYVPQRSTVAAAFTVRQIVKLGRYALPPSRRRVDEALEQCELTDLADRPYHALSVGQQQRVTLARVLAQTEPGGVLVLDEPMSAMDLRHMQETVRLLRAEAARGSTILLALHDLALAAAIGDDAWLLEGGRLVASGGVCDVLTAEQLQSVFGVEFEWTHDDAGRPRLLPRWARPASPAPAPGGVE